jgi:hypothetical protein
MPVTGKNEWMLLTGFQLIWHECIAKNYDQLYLDIDIQSASRLLSYAS